MDKYANQAQAEYNSESGVHHGGEGARPFWNTHSSQFIFAPKLQFPAIMNSAAYRFTARDKNGTPHVFERSTPTESLAHIWAEIPTGVVFLTVEVLDKNGNPTYTVGSRTFFKCDPFPGRAAYPSRACSYRECAAAAFRYVYNAPEVQYWLTHGVPKPDYPHNVYPAKTISSIIHAMVSLAENDKALHDSALLLARRAADYLLSISFGKGHPLEGLPPTYSFDGLDEDAVNEVAPAAKGCVGTTMMIYPVSAAAAYLELADATGDRKYLGAALAIGEYYKRTVLPCGSWYLLFDCDSGKPLTENICLDFNLVNFFHSLYGHTGDAAWHTLEAGCYDYIVGTCLKSYKWEGQFEDVPVTGNYINLTHFMANAIINYVAANMPDNEMMREEAKDLMRYVEDQFVVWGEYAPWILNDEFGPRLAPAGLEQYNCYAPIDASTATIFEAFVSTYTLTGDRLYIEKALTLADTVTRVQDRESGKIPTFWVGDDCEYGKKNFWINCQIATAFKMMKLADFTESNGIE